MSERGGRILIIMNVVVQLGQNSVVRLVQWWKKMVAAEAGFCLEYCSKVNIKMVMSACTAVSCGEIKETSCKKDIGNGKSVVQKMSSNNFSFL